MRLYLFLPENLLFVNLCITFVGVKQKQHFFFSLPHYHSIFLTWFM